MNRLRSIVVLLPLLLSGCIVVNETGLGKSLGHVKGTQAASEIQNAAILADLSRLTALNGGRPTVSVVSLVADKVAGIKPNAYYKERDVKACTKEINNIWHWLFFTGGGSVLFFCDLKPDSSLWDP